VTQGKLPVATVSRGRGPVVPLVPHVDRPDVGPVAVTRSDGSASTVGTVLAETSTDAFAVLQDGALVTEVYGPEGGADLAHGVLSVTKSVVGCVAAILLDRGILDEHQRVRELVPELASSGYADATVRHLLDMRSGAAFLEAYDDPGSDISRLDGWLLEGRGLYAFLKTLRAERPHGGSFLYRSSETDVLGWACERASGTGMPELVSELVWAPLGAEHDAGMLTDASGTPVHDGGLEATARDLLRFGQMLLDGGRVPDPGGTRSVVPSRWLRQAWAVDADVRTAFLESPAEPAFPGGWYRNQFWFRPGPYGDTLLCLGIHGQLVHVCRRTRTVSVKLSSWTNAQEPAYLQDTLRACDAVGGALSGARPVRSQGAGPSFM